MVYESLIVIIEQNVENLALSWFKAVKNSTYMQTYNSLDDPEIVKRGRVLFSNLLRWVSTGAVGEEIESYFLKVGSERLHEGFPLSEVQYALYLEKKVLTDLVIGKKEITELLTAAETIDIMSILNGYFDVGSFYIVRGYLAALFKQLDDKENLSKEELQNMLHATSLMRESKSGPEDDIFHGKLGDSN